MLTASLNKHVLY